MRKALRLLSLAVGIAIILMGIPSIVSAAADFKIGDLKISPTFTYLDKANINISVRVSNLGDAAGTKTIELFINGTVEDSQDITLDPGTSQQVNFNIVGDEVGEFKVRIAAEEGSFSIAPENLELSNLLVNPPQAAQGDTVVISITAKNTSTDEALSYDALHMLIDGQIVESKPVKLEAGASSTITFSRTADKEGDYIVVIGDKTGSFSIKASFWTAYPPYLWFVFGAVAGVLVMLVVVIAIIPKRRGTAKPTREKKQSGPRDSSQERPQPAPQPGQGRQMPPPQPVQQPPGGRPMQPPPAQAPGGRPTQPPPHVVQGRPPMQPAAQPPMPGATPPGQPPRPQGAFGRPARGAPAPIFSVRNLSVSPTRAREQDEVTITAVISNSGTATGQYSLVLRINSVVEKINELTISPGLSQESSFTIVKDTSGEYLVEVDGLRGGFTVVPRIPATFTISNLSITPERVNQGDTIYISAIVANTGEIKGSYSVVLRIKGIAEGIEEVELEPGANKKVTFEIVKDAAGFYPVSLEHLSGKFVVEMDWKE